MQGPVSPETFCSALLSRRVFKQIPPKAKGCVVSLSGRMELIPAAAGIYVWASPQELLMQAFPPQGEKLLQGNQ